MQRVLENLLQVEKWVLSTRENFNHITYHTVHFSITFGA